MNLNTLQLDELKQLGSNSECTVYDLGDGTCYKKYFLRSANVETIYYNAKIAHEFGIAPEVYERGKRGYRTEIVEMLTSTDVCKDCDCDFLDCGNCENLDVMAGNRYKELKTEVKELFGEAAIIDLHIFNIGLKNGKMIMIDFGEASNLSGKNDKN